MAIGGFLVNVTNASETLVVANKSRHLVTIQNLSTTAMLTLSPVSPAVSKAGINLAPGTDATHPGESYSFPEGYKGAVYAIMSAADATDNVSYVEA